MDVDILKPVGQITETVNMGMVNDIREFFESLEPSEEEDYSEEFKELKFE